MKFAEITHKWLHKRVIEIFKNKLFWNTLILVLRKI
jgi:hypothetical protein